MRKTVLAIAGIAVLAACNTNTQKTEINNSSDSAAIAVATDSMVTGADRDEHGCIGSAGYQWSVLKNKCIRTFEDADAKLLPTEDTATYISNAVLIFNDDQSKVELYMPNQKGSLLLDRTGKEGNYIWKNDSLEVFAWKGYALRKNGKVIFHGE